MSIEWAELFDIKRFLRLIRKDLLGLNKLAIWAVPAPMFPKRQEST